MANIKITLNGQEIETTTDKTILQTALANGIHIPHYCWHPGLTVAGNCRMCLVEIEGIPKLQISCGTYCRDGMAVHSTNDRVRKAVRRVLEFLLINHPVDCPVCDQAGECWLQIYYMTVGRYDSRFTENKVTKHKKATPIGKWVSLDQERCILCSRCVRFTREITGTNEMAIYNRGDHSEIDVYPGGQLNNRYSANIVDICPVGALTCRDFRFKCRVWYLKTAPSICTGCARGCNTEIHYNLDRPHKKGGQRVMRLKPRHNPEVNRYWLCDDGRYNYRFIDENRIRHSSTSSSNGRRQLYTREALDLVANLLRNGDGRSAACLISADSTNEELYAARKLFHDELKIPCLLPDTDVRTGDSDDFLIHEDKHPNTRGAMEIFGLTEKELFDLERLPDYVKENSIGLLLVNRHELSDDVLAALETADCRVVFLGTNVNRTADTAHICLPLATYAEKTGTFTNFEGRVQKVAAALAPDGQAEPEWQIYAELARRLELELDLDSPAALFKAMSGEVDFYRDLKFTEIGPYGEMGSHE